MRASPTAMTSSAQPLVLALSDTLAVWGPVALAVLGLLGFAALWTRLKTLEARLKAQDTRATLEEVRAALAKAAEERGDLDHRRLEHVLNEVRGGIKRTESSVLAVIENQANQPEAPQAQAAPPRQPALRERVTNRLLALGFTDIRIVTPSEELKAITDEGGDGSVALEARQGATHVKGRVQIRAGAIDDVDLKPFYPMFP